MHQTMYGDAKSFRHLVYRCPFASEEESLKKLVNTFCSFAVRGKVSLAYDRPVGVTSIDQIIIGVIILLGFIICAHCDPIQRVPEYQDVEAALESTQCSVREEIVDIREIHPTLPSDAKLMPSCVLLRRCSGCCQSDRHRCMPASIYSSRLEISQQRLSLKTFNYITLNFTHHAECSCQSPVNPTCIPRVCSDSEIWNKDLCLCEERCAPRECGHRQQWNPDKCRCQCQQCHPNRVVHARFLQDDVTCLCACRHSGHGRPRCRKKARFSLTQCTCVAHRRYLLFRRT